MILESIFSGDFSIETFSRPSDSEYQKLYKEISDILDTIEQQDPHQAGTVKEPLSKVYDVQYPEAIHMLKIGFAAGIGLQNEVENVLAQMYSEL